MYQILCGVGLRTFRRNRLSSRALIGCLFAAMLALPVNAAETSGTMLSLETAIKRALSKNPEIQVYRFREIGLSGLVQAANMRPQFELSAEAENFAGSGDFDGSDSAEFTLALSSVIELGGKRMARVAAVSARQRVLDDERQAQALDLLGEVTRRYVDVAATQARLELAVSARAMAQEVVRSVARRSEAGAAPEAELFRARAQFAQAKLVVSKMQNRLRASRLALSVLWGDVHPDFVRVAGNLHNLGGVGDFDSLLQRAVQNPAIEVFASEERLREAEYQLAKSQSGSNIDWSLGVRQFQDTDDTALVALFSVPLYSGKQNSAALQSARAARDEVSTRRESAILNLRTRLFDAYQQRKLGIETANSLQVDIIPVLSQALKQTQLAYENGRYGYQEWAAAQQELMSAEYALIAAAASALQSGATIEQLTSEPLLPSLEIETSDMTQESY